MAVLKGGITWAAELFIYTLPIIGGLLRTLELVEVSNVVVFAILGMGLGAATLWLSKRTGIFSKVIPLTFGIFIVLSTSYGVRHHLWVQQVAIESELLPTQARQITDRLLIQTTGNKGLWGFFQYTVQAPILPTDLSAMQTANEDDKWFRSELTRYSGLEPGVFTLLFHLTGWGIRGFYVLLAVVTAIIYFTKGLVWVETRSQSPNQAPK